MIHLSMCFDVGTYFCSLVQKYSELTFWPLEKVYFHKSIYFYKKVYYTIRFNIFNKQT